MREDIYWQDFRDHFKYDPPPMYEGHRYLCYGRKDAVSQWYIEELIYSGIQQFSTVRQPLYTLIENHSPQTYPGPAGMLVPFADITQEAERE